MDREIKGGGQFFFSFLYFVIKLTAARYNGSRLPYPILTDFSASFLSPSRGVSVADFGPLSSLFLFVRSPSFFSGSFAA